MDTLTLAPPLTPEQVNAAADRLWADTARRVLAEALSLRWGTPDPADLNDWAEMANDPRRWRRGKNGVEEVPR